MGALPSASARARRSDRRPRAIPCPQPRGDDVVGVGLAEQAEQLPLDGLGLLVAVRQV